MRIAKKNSIFTIFLFFSIFCFLIYISINKSHASDIKLTQISYSDSTEIFKEIETCYNNGSKGPMMIVQGNLCKDNKLINVYWVFLAGTELVDGQATNVKSDLLAAFEKENDYEKSILNNITKYIPKNSNIVLSGHSLGGMVSQQLAANEELTKNYNIIANITFGSPLVNPYGREGDLKRFIDKQDVVQYLSYSNFACSDLTKTNVNYSDSSYTNPIDSHMYSYGEEETWKGYDVLGAKDGTSTFTFYEENKTYYKCPVLE